MSSPIVQDFAFSVKLDCGLLIESLAAGEAVQYSEVLSLAAAVQAIYVTVTLESRQLSRIQQCFELWSETAELLKELCAGWIDVATTEPAVKWLQTQMEHYHGLALDRVELYSEGWDRRRYVKRKAADSLA